jgi:hypothetical protein
LADVDPIRIAVASQPKISESTVYGLLFVLVLAGLGVWGFLYRRGVDRELEEKGKFIRLQNDYAGHDINTITPAGTETPAQRPLRVDEWPGYKEAMEKSKKTMESYNEMKKAEEQALKNIKVPTPIPPPDR